MNDPGDQQPSASCVRLAADAPRGTCSAGPSGPSLLGCCKVWRCSAGGGHFREGQRERAPAHPLATATTTTARSCLACPAPHWPTRFAAGCTSTSRADVDEGLESPPGGESKLCFMMFTRPIPSTAVTFDFSCADVGALCAADGSGGTADRAIAKRRAVECPEPTGWALESSGASLHTVGSALAAP